MTVSSYCDANVDADVDVAKAVKLFLLAYFCVCPLCFIHKTYFITCYYLPQWKERKWFRSIWKMTILKI